MIQEIPLKYSSLAPDVWTALHELKRTGWVQWNVQNPESVQEHIISLRNFAVSIFDELVDFSDKEKEDLVDMLEVHDWPEAFVGDLVFLGEDKDEIKKFKEDKYALEKKALRDLCDSIGEKGDEIFSLWLRFEEGDDRVAVLARQIDEYQAIKKAWEYEQAQQLKGLTQEFIGFSQKHITDPLLLKKLALLKEQSQFV